MNIIVKPTPQKRVTRNYQILYQHIDCNFKLSIGSMLHFFTDLSLYHTEQSGFSFDYLEANDYYWVMTAMEIEIERYPMLNEEVIVSTEGYNLKKFNAYRIFDITDNERNRIASAKSIYMLINHKRNRPMRIPDEMYDGYLIERNREDVFYIEQLSLPEEVESQRNYLVDYRDIDTNQHANNVCYAEWALESLDYQFRKEYSCHKLTINYLKECLYNQTISSVCGRDASLDAENRVSFRHAIYLNGESAQTQKAASLLCSHWHKT